MRIFLSDASQVALVVRNSPASAGDVGSIPGSGRSPGERNSNPVQYSCLENPIDRGAWEAIVHRVAESDTTEATEHARIAKVKRCYRCDKSLSVVDTKLTKSEINLVGLT